jgi:hypothetical protein
VSDPLHWNAVDLACACDLNMRDAEDAFSALDDDDWEAFCQEHKKAYLARNDNLVVEIKDAVARSDWKAVIDLSGGGRLRQIGLGDHDLWCAAMTAQYGPVGIHDSRLGSDGRPTAETLVTFPDVARTMLDAEERCRCIAARLR